VATGTRVGRLCVDLDTVTSTDHQRWHDTSLVDPLNEAVAIGNALVGLKRGGRRQRRWPAPQPNPLTVAVLAHRYRRDSRWSSAALYRVSNRKARLPIGPTNGRLLIGVRWLAAAAGERKKCS